MQQSTSYMYLVMQPLLGNLNTFMCMHFRKLDKRKDSSKFDDPAMKEK